MILYKRNYLFPIFNKTIWIKKNKNKNKKEASGDEIGLAEKRFMAGSLQIASK